MSVRPLLKDQATLNFQTTLEKSPRDTNGGSERGSVPGNIPATSVHRWAVESKGYTGVVAKGARCLGLVDAAAYLGVSPDTVRTLEWRGVLQRVRLSDGNGGEIRKILFDVRDLDALIDRSKG